MAGSVRSYKVVADLKSTVEGDSELMDFLDREAVTRGDQVRLVREGLRLLIKQRKEKKTRG